MNVQTEYRDVPAMPVSGVASIRARFAMMAVAYGAKADTVEPEAIDRAGALVFQTFGADHDLTREMEHFIDTVTAGTGSKKLWTDAGDRLLRAVHGTTWCEGKQHE
ncbi:hypothetical protein ACEUZ9_001577 [Paracoccus litorisediminis]|jgi:hypothetical protein|uniref:Uncharacterized protein n=1 Tax=Paracoccus litorisediminis TaxID=2006130 RepID=A0A844HEF2_9RHOB|nr:hypothetical protein [Paracoccus litorisediminis]MTH57660.1 hypothetical protein [Paracoccus litorisediminis]